MKSNNEADVRSRRYGAEVRRDEEVVTATRKGPEGI